MVEKRRFTEKGGRSKYKQALHACAFRTVIAELMQNETILESFLRRLVREEVQHAFQPVLHPSPRPSFHQAGTSGVRRLQLRFVNKLPSKIFTANSVKDEDGTPIQIELFDTSSRTTVKSGPLSSIKIKIVVLNGDFCYDEEDDWTEQEFHANVLKEREGKRPLLLGDANVTLREGVGCIGEIIFTDNSSWMRSRKFRLGAIVAQKLPAEASIREARSESFMVKDHRGEINQKRFPPSLSDEIWRLKMIGKDGAFHQRLASCEIKTVKDLLQKYVTNPSELKNIFGRISDSMWEKIISHAMTCDKDEGTKYIYHTPGESIGLLFNSIYQVVGAIFNGQDYCSLDELDVFQKQLVENLKRRAYENENDIIPFNDPSRISFQMLSAGLQAEPISVPGQGLQQFDFSVIHQDQPEAWLGFNNSEIHAGESSHQLEASAVQNSHPMQRNSPVMEEYYFSGLSNAGYGWSTSGSELPDFPTSLLPPITTWEQENGIFFASSNQADVGIFPFRNSSFVIRTRNPKASWCKIRAAVKWGSVWRGVAARRMQGY